MPNRSEIVARIHKLRQMTTDRGCTEAEAQAAATKLAQLLAEHNVSETEETIRTAEYTTISLMTLARCHEWTSCGKAIGKLFHTRFWFKHDTIDLGLPIPRPVIYANFFGARQDAEASVGMVELIYNSINAASKTRGNSNLSFRLGMAHRFRERLNAMLPAQDCTLTNALVLVKDATVDENFVRWCKENNIHLHSVKAPEPYNQKAYAAGKSAASSIDMGSTKLATGAPIRAISSR